jgi:hypothetical protein
MYIRWTNFKCPHCGSTWSSRVVSAPRPGKEMRVCSSCGQQFKTHDVEWQHMTTKQKLGYLLNEWMVAWLLLYALIVFGSFKIGDAPRTLSDYREKAQVFLIVTGVMLGPFAVVKWLRIYLSKQRTHQLSANDLNQAGRVL